jgi:hypothetical protein
MIGLKPPAITMPSGSYTTQRDTTYRPSISNIF